MPSPILAARGLAASERDANVVATATNNGKMNITFTIEGGLDGLPYDVFVNAQLGTSFPWAWKGQGYHCKTYTVTGLPNSACFLILGTPQDTDRDGLTDAFENLVSKSDPNVYTTDGTGLADGWEAFTISTQRDQG